MVVAPLDGFWLPPWFPDDDDDIILWLPPPPPPLVPCILANADDVTVELGVVTNAWS